MTFRLLILLLFCGALTLPAQTPDYNLELISNVTPLPGGNPFTDIWGFVDQDSTEYAIVGHHDGVLIFDLSDPANPEMIQFIEGSNSGWRDIKSWKDHVYVVADEGDDGLLVIDMQQPQDTISWSFYRPQVDINGTNYVLDQCHNLYIDEKGYAYLSGCNYNSSGGIIIFNVDANPVEPEYVNTWTARYSHDVFVRGDTMWSSDIYAGVFTVIDATDREELMEMAMQQTGYEFTHNSWLSDDGKYLFTTDEREYAYTESYDVSDLSNIRFLDRYRPSVSFEFGVIPHNTHYYQGYLITSHYTEGVKVVDVHEPDNMVEVGSYDTYDLTSSGFDGCWGAYPYLPSGIILATDRTNGLFLLQPKYTRAAYLEGTVTDSVTGAQLQGVEVELYDPLDIPRLEETDLFGQYKIGRAEEGTVTVRFAKQGYKSKLASAQIVNGQISTLDVQLQPESRVTISGLVISDADGQPIDGAQIVFEDQYGQLNSESMADGSFQFRDIFDVAYDIYIAAWGYEHLLVEDANLNTTSTLIFELQPGYQDDFFADLGWTTDSGSDAVDGYWVREEPVGTYDRAGNAANTDTDLPDDLGDKCWITGNGGGNVGSDDVDGGPMVLISPEINVEGYNTPVLSHHIWFYNTDGQNGAHNDTLQILIRIDGVDHLLDKIGDNGSYWRPAQTYELIDVLDGATRFQVVYQVSDDLPNYHVAEAAVDGFRIYDSSPTAAWQPPVIGVNARLSPNPFHGSTWLSYDLGVEVQDLSAVLYDMNGRRLAVFPLPEKVGMKRIQPPTAGMYLLTLESEHGILYRQRIIGLD